VGMNKASQTKFQAIKFLFIKFRWCVGKNKEKTYRGITAAAG